MKKLVSLFLSVVILIMCTGCGSTESKLIGTWEIYGTASGGEFSSDGDCTFEFAEDGTLKITEDGSTDVGSYSVSDNRIYTQCGSYTKDFGIKEITSSELVLYKLDNAGVEYYFTKD